jgi:hypothetical protein
VVSEPFWSLFTWKPQREILAGVPGVADVGFEPT